MDREHIREYFDNRASEWDSHNRVNPIFLEKIFDYSEIDENSKVLDVACGTGVLTEPYMKRNVKSVTAVDISPEMIGIAEKKYVDTDNIKFICGDALTLEFPEKFNRIMIYNAFPHFPDPEKTVERMAELLESGGRLTVAHGMSREKLEEHHRKVASSVSIGLPEASELKRIFDRFLKTDVCFSGDFYIVSGKKE